MSSVTHSSENKIQFSSIPDLLKNIFVHDLENNVSFVPDQKKSDLVLSRIYKKNILFSLVPDLFQKKRCVPDNKNNSFVPDKMK